MLSKRGQQPCLRSERMPCSALHRAWWMAQVHERWWVIPSKPLLVEGICIQFSLFFPPLSPPAAVITSHTSHWLLLAFLIILQLILYFLGMHFQNLQIMMFATSTLMFLLFLSLISWLVLSESGLQFQWKWVFLSHIWFKWESVSCFTKYDAGLVWGCIFKIRQQK